jgi:hypothetical protein
MTLPSSEKMAAITADSLKELLSYDAETGTFRWRVALCRKYKIGAIAGTVNDQGYRIITIRGRLYRAHRLAWLYVHGEWPSKDVDHIDGDRGNNRAANLREATNAENLWNRGKASHNKSGYKGVYFLRKSKRWVAEINVDGKRKYLGRFKDPADAHRAYEAAANAQHGEFARAS